MNLALHLDGHITMAFLVFCLLSPLTVFWTTVATSSPAPFPKSSDVVVPLNDETPLAGEGSLPSSTTKSTTTNAESSSYLTRLDFISVIVICAIVAFCFGICVVIGCRRKKRHAANHEITDSLPPSFTDSRSEPRITNLIYSPSELRVPESPPPTYSIIERQTSFTSYVSQTSSQCEIPPDYDEALSFGEAANGESFANRISHPSSINGSERSTGRFFPTKGVAAAARSKRSESARARGPPPARSHRSSSDVGRARRARLSSRPATVSEDDASQCSVTASTVTAGSSGHEATRDDGSHTVNVTAEIIPALHIHNPSTELNSDSELARPLLARMDPSGSEIAEDKAESESCNPNNESSMTRKLTLV